MNKDIKKSIIEFCKENQIVIHSDYSLHEQNTFRVGGNAELFILPDTLNKILVLQKVLLNFKVNTFLLGGGSNLLISDSGYDGVVLKLNYAETFELLSEKDNILSFKVPANIRSSFVGKKISSMEYTGLEFLTTIPGSIGGAIVQNAGCYGSEIGNYVQNIGVSKDGNFYEINNLEAGFSYRNSIFKHDHGLYVHSCTFRVPKGNKSEIENTINQYKENRKRSQPKNRKNAGSIFKNPPGMKAWTLINDCGLSGYRIGNAEVSREHANFIVNTGKAKSSEIFEIIQHIQSTVAEKFKINLEPEIVFLGIFPVKK